MIIETEKWLDQPPLRPQPTPKPSKAIEIRSRIFIEIEKEPGQLTHDHINQNQIWL